MFGSVSVFLDFNLPNATTWFYFSFLLAVAIFFKFGRLLSIRNFDVVALFALMPALMVIQVSHPKPKPTPTQAALEAGRLVADAGVSVIAPPHAMLSQMHATIGEKRAEAETARWLWLAYLWLLCGSAFFFVRCLVDLTLVQRPLLAPNLSIGGLGWFSMALIACLTAVAFRQPDRSTTPNAIVIASPQTSPESVSVTLARQQVDPSPLMMRGFAVVGHLVVVLGLILIGRLHFQDAAGGTAAATFYLILPYTGMYVRYADHVWPTAIIVWTMLAHRRPSLAGLLLGLASGVYYFPALLFPVFISFYRSRGAARFVFFFFLSLALVLGGVAFALDMQGTLHDSIRQAFDQAAWQPWKIPPPDTEGFWTGVLGAYRIPVFLAYFAFVVATAFWPAPKNFGHVLALSAAILIGTQFWYGEQGGTYVLWHLPLLLLVVFRPNLESYVAPPISPTTDWLCRIRSWFARIGK